MISADESVTSFDEKDGNLDLYSEADAFGTVSGNGEVGSSLKSITDPAAVETNGSNELSMDHRIKMEDNDDDLYNSVITQHASPPHNGSNSNDVSLTGSTDAMAHITGSGTDKRKFSCYIGNITWWTTDKDLVDLIVAAGITDLIDVKFYENRQNGQSKGYALVSFDSEASVRLCMERITHKKLHSQQLVVLPYTKHSLAQFEAATKKPGERTSSSSSSGQSQMNALKSGNNPPEPGKLGGPVFIGTFRIGMASKPEPVPIAPSALPPPQMLGGLPPLMVRAAIPLGASPPFGAPPPGVRILAPPQHVILPHSVAAAINRPPPGVIPQQPHHHHLPQLMRVVGAPPPGGLPSTTIPPPGSHVNPNFYPGLAAGGAPTPLGTPSSASSGLGGAGGGGGQPGGPMDAALGEAEFEEIMNRNRTVSSSAISRAVSDASAGDFASAIETLVTAISLIRQSKVAHDDRCKILVSSLQDTLRGIEAKSFGGAGLGGGLSGAPHRSSKGDRSGRSRSRERSKRRRDRSRSRSRSRGERFDDYSPRRRRY